MVLGQARRHISRLPFWITAPVIVAAASVLLDRLPFFVHLQQLTRNARVVARAAVCPGHADNRLLLVGISDESLATFQRQGVGRWPWPRNVHAEFVQALSARPPAVVGWDVLFTESDTEEHDGALAGALSEAHFPTVLGAVGLPKTSSAPQGPIDGEESSPPLGHIEGDLRRVPDAGQKLLPLPLFCYAAQFGFVNVDPDSDGIRRYEPMVVRFGDQLYPGFALRIVMNYWKLKPEDIVVHLGHDLTIPSRQVTIPIDRAGRMRINYRFENNGFASVSYANLCVGLEDVIKGGALPSQCPNPEGKIVLVGITATGVTDSGPSPFTPLSPLVMVHLNALNNILESDYLIMVPRSWIWLGWIVVAAASLAFTRRLPVLVASLLALGVTLGFILVAFAVFIFWSVELMVAVPVLSFLLLTAFELGRRIFEEQRARRELRGRFASFLAPAVVEEIARSGQDPVLGGSRKDVTILFSDIRGFTSMSEVAKVEDIVTQLNQYFTRMVECVNNHNGTLHKFIGDAVMAVWGDLVSEGPAEDAAAAVRTALEMRTALAELNRDWESTGLPPLKIGIGINCGSVLVGYIGAPQRMEFTVIGDAVNVASRIEGATKDAGQDILIGEETASLVTEKIAIQPVGVIRVKGHTKPHVIYRVLSEMRDQSEADQHWLRRFRLGFQTYLDKRFAEALAVFEECAAARPDDSFAADYAAKAADLVRNPPNAKWDGVPDLRTKGQ